MEMISRQMANFFALTSFLQCSRVPMMSCPWSQGLIAVKRSETKVASTHNSCKGCRWLWTAVASTAGLQHKPRGSGTCEPASAGLLGACFSASKCRAKDVPLSLLLVPCQKPHPHPNGSSLFLTCSWHGFVLGRAKWSHLSQHRPAVGPVNLWPLGSPAATKQTGNPNSQDPGSQRLACDWMHIHLQIMLCDSPVC